MRRRTVTKKKNKTIKIVYQWIVILFLTIGIIAALYHNRNRILYYFSFKTNKLIQTDKDAKVRICQVLKNHTDKVIGIDVSEFQGNINWEDVDSVDTRTIGFVFVRATAGSNKTDTKFYENWNSIKNKKIIRGAYHYYRPNENSIEQANNFIKTVKLQKGDLPPVLDIEKLPTNQSIDSLKVGLKRWLKKVNEHYKVKPIIYSGEKYYDDFLKKDFPDYTFWIANYNPWIESINDNWLFWQFTEKAVVNGINEKVDVNIYNGTPKMLNYLTIN